MVKRTIVIASGLIVFLAGIILIGLSNVTKSGLIERREAFGQPLEGSGIIDVAMNLPYAGKYGINFTGSFQGHEGEPIFYVRDYQNNLIFAGPGFGPGTTFPIVIDFQIAEPGLYSIDFHVVASNDSRVELYRYGYEVGDVRPYVYLFYVGASLAIAGIIANVVGLFVLSEPRE
ncbi:MAG: hypothetical protein JSV57_05050 [Candidatus Bathyarchaeota archaeon]|nr:MAG: hypothetical protein JSV57_05050 [Candidatus Bathyarchaeota archaeon]